MKPRLSSVLNYSLQGCGLSIQVQVTKVWAEYSFIIYPKFNFQKKNKVI